MLSLYTFIMLSLALKSSYRAMMKEKKVISFMYFMIWYEGCLLEGLRLENNRPLSIMTINLRVGFHVSGNGL